MVRGRYIRCEHCGLPHEAERAACPLTGKPLEEPTEFALDPLPEPRRGSMVGLIVDGSYELVEQLGAGSMGNVYRAHNPRIQKDVAIKILRRVFGDSERSKERFLREARATGRIEHRNVIRVWDAGMTLDGLPYIVMELLDGESLGERIARQGSLPYSEIVSIWKQMLLGLCAAHEAGVVHRDVKPDNVFITNEGVVRLVDFGIARMLTGNLSSLTQTGELVGTPGYLSPEQAHSVDVDHLSDAWGATVVLYEMLTGQLPFPGRNIVEVLSAALTEDAPAPSTLRPGMPGGFDELVRVGLQKEPARRADCGALLACLHQINAELAGMDHGDTLLSDLGKTIGDPMPRSADLDLTRADVVPLLPNDDDGLD